MRNEKWQKQIEAWFDGETRHAGDARRLIAEHPECAAYYEQLKALRSAGGERDEPPVIADAQFPAFMAGIHDEIGQRAASGRGFRTPTWLTMASVAAAALVVVFAVFLVFTAFTGGTAPVSANEVEHVSTELEGATVEWYDDEHGDTTLWISVSEDDVW